MKVMTKLDLISTFGGDDNNLNWDWGDFLNGIGWTLGVGCGVTLNPAVCGAAVVVGGISLFV